MTVRAAEDAWNERNPAKVALAFTMDNQAVRQRGTAGSLRRAWGSASNGVR